MKHLHLLSTAIFLFTANALYSASFSANFDSPDYVANNATTLVGQKDWALNDSENMLSSFIDPVGAPVDYSGTLGGATATPNLTRNVNLTHAAVLPLSPGVAFKVTLVVVESDAAFPGQDGFGWTFTDTGNTEILRIAFAPTNAVGRRELFYYVNGGSPVSVLSADILTGTTYNLSVNFGTSGADATFNASLGGGNFGATIPGKSGASLSTIGADFDVAGATVGDAGSNFMYFDNLSVVPVPEPSVFITGTTLLGLAFRRRR